MVATWTWPGRRGQRMALLARPGAHTAAQGKDCFLSFARQSWGAAAAACRDLGRQRSQDRHGPFTG